MNNLQTKDYAMAAYCFINAMIDAPAPRTKDDGYRLLSHLHHHFRNTKDIGKKYRALCEKACMMAIFGGAGKRIEGPVWDTLSAPTLGLPIFNISGQKIRAFKAENNSLFPPLDIVTKNLAEYLREPSEEKMDSCAKGLIEIDKLEWMSYFTKSLARNIFIPTP